MYLIGKEAWNWLQDNKIYLEKVKIADIEFYYNKPFIKCSYDIKPNEIDINWFKNDDGNWSKITEEHSIIIEVKFVTELE